MNTCLIVRLYEPVPRTRSTIPIRPNRAGPWQQHRCMVPRGSRRRDSLTAQAIAMDQSGRPRRSENASSKVGRASVQVRDAMTRNVVGIRADATIGKAIELMLQAHLGGLPVFDAEGRLVGIVSEGDLLRRAELGTDEQRPGWIE